MCRPDWREPNAANLSEARFTGLKAIVWMLAASHLKCAHDQISEVVTLDDLGKSRQRPTHAANPTAGRAGDSFALERIGSVRVRQRDLRTRDSLHESGLPPSTLTQCGPGIPSVSRSKIAAAPIPPPTHIVTMPRR